MTDSSSSTTAAEGKPSSGSRSFVTSRLVPIFVITTLLFIALGVIFIGTDPNDARGIIQRLLTRFFLPALAVSAVLTIAWAGLRKLGLVGRTIDIIVLCLCLAFYAAHYVYPKANLVDRYLARPLTAAGWNDAAALLKMFNRSISDKDGPLMLWASCVTMAAILVSMVAGAIWKVIKFLLCCNSGRR
jgi:hypothetical protein